jgi:hypothetical protein
MWNDINKIQPDEYQNVLFYCGGKYMVGMYYGKSFCDRLPKCHPLYKIPRKNFGKYARYAEPAGDGYVATHWMELPEKPNGEN